MTHLWRALSVACLLGSAAVPAAYADEPPSFELTIKDHHYQPAELKVPAGKRFVLKVRNLDATAEEFESSALKVEKVIAGNSEGTVRMRALDPGRYDFWGDYHPKIAKGVLIAE